MEATAGSCAKRECLKQRLLDAFSARKEIYQVYLFGSEIGGKSDRYSDIDMAVCSNHLSATWATFRDVLESISPIRATLPLWGDANGYCEMVLLKGYSPYQKVDFSLHDDADSIPVLGPSLLAYEDVEKAWPSRTRLDPVRIKRDVASELAVVLFTIVRFTKGLFRGDIDLYRHWKRITDATLILLYERHFGWEGETTRRALSGYETACLRQALAPWERHQVERVLPLHARPDLVSSYRASLDLFVALSEEKAGCLGVKLDVQFAAYMRRFLDAELRRFRGASGGEPGRAGVDGAGRSRGDPPGRGQHCGADGGKPGHARDRAEWCADVSAG